MMTMIIVRTTKPNMFETVYAQDLKPPTTCKTSPNVTSTFGPNMPGGPNGSSIAGNSSQGAVILVI